MVFMGRMGPIGPMGRMCLIGPIGPMRPMKTFYRRRARQNWLGSVYSQITLPLRSISNTFAVA